MGWARLDCTKRNSPKQSSPPMSAPMTVGEVQPAEPARIRPNVTPTRPRVISAAPR